MRTGIIAALRSEARTLDRLRGTMTGGSSCVVTVSGPGQANAARAANQLMDDGCDQLMYWGIAGGLSDMLAVGDLVLAKHVCGIGESSIACDPDWLNGLGKALAQLNPSVGDLVTRPTPVCTAEDKRQLHAQTGALAVDMESYAAALVAHARACPFVALRAISDAWQDELPGAVLNGVRDDGSNNPGAVALALIKHPWQIGAVIRTGHRYRQALASLTAAATILGND